MALRWTPDDILVRAVGSVGAAGVGTYLKHATNPLIPALSNDGMWYWLLVFGDLFNVAPDGTEVGDALDAATDYAIGALAAGLFESRMLQTPFGSFGLGGAPAPATPATPASATATGAPLPSPANPPVATVPAASGSAVFDTATLY